MFLYFVFFLKVHTEWQRQIHNLIALCNKSVEFTDASTANNALARNYVNIFPFIAV